MKQKVLESVSRVRESKDVTKHKCGLIDMQIIDAEGGGTAAPGCPNVFQGNVFGQPGSSWKQRLLFFSRNTTMDSRHYLFLST